MAQVLIMPRQGNTVESCVIVEWKKNEGDRVTTDTLVVEVETDKATFEVPAGAEGTILKILYQAGDDVPVLQPIMVIGEQGEDWQSLVGGQEAAQADKTLAPGPAVQKSSKSAQAEPFGQQKEVQTLRDGSPIRGENERILISPRAKNLAVLEAVDYTKITGSGPEGRIIEQDILAHIAARHPLTAAAKEILRLNLLFGEKIPESEKIFGSGLGGRITGSDIAQSTSIAFSSSGAQAEEKRSALTEQISDEYTDTPIRGVRKLISDRMMASLAGTAQFTLNASANAVQMQRLRNRFKESPAELGLSKITINDLTLFLVSRLLPQFPAMNALKLDAKIRAYKHVHLGMAVDTPRGLMVPVIRFADKLSLIQISNRAKELASGCLDGSINPDDLRGSTFTVSNLGSAGIESFTPIINAPEVAILGVCGIQPKPVDKGQGSYDILPHLSFSLTIDHAVVDGSPAAFFVKTLCAAVKDIDLWIAK